MSRPTGLRSKKAEFLALEVGEQRLPQVVHHPLPGELGDVRLHRPERVERHRVPKERGDAARGPPSPPARDMVRWRLDEIGLEELAAAVSGKRAREMRDESLCGVSPPTARHQRAS